MSPDQHPSASTARIRSETHHLYYKPHVDVSCRGDGHVEMVKGAASRKSSGPKQPLRTASKTGDSRFVRSVDGKPSLPLDLQQRCLNIFRDAFEPGIGDSSIVQEVKGHLYNRDFAAAFAKDEYLRVYAGRWSPARALGYLDVLHGLQAQLVAHGDGSKAGNECMRVVCLGGGAGSEVVALAGWLSMLFEEDVGSMLHAHFVDVASWNVVVSDLHHQAITAPQLSKYASAAAREANKPLVQGGAFFCAFHQQDVLDWPDSELRSIVTPDTRLVTLLFTLNELYSTSLAKTQQLLSRLTDAMPADSCLLVVDSPGSYSTVSFNSTEKRYPMLWLLDHLLLGGEAKPAGPQWEKVVSDGSRWFRLPPGLEYPIELENMRYQLHLYRRVNNIEAG
ncbi:hypothetical protein BAUCODRAFT_400146 [Baudoinia panamericana UAMH 10762]|uniref:Uncharacterized protein n=1 Tax=Baudoinia panamericana (strain UAMH 10762) TaxID=717646 RepID=M2LXD0_BAUPA|nr:uncharacterized protein BAUCODRAFT_400146 [Baudoinia panamericana UAMH 10762]EMC99352.1 hypothetical protein BAUCODRAFT_400146 [Baudoinia panamericana UAMH 10762]